MMTLVSEHGISFPVLIRARVPFAEEGELVLRENFLADTYSELLLWNLLLFF